MLRFSLALLAVLAGGVLFADSKAFLKHSITDDDQYDLFMLGRSFFKIPWVEAPSATTARDGLGPVFNANTCTSCHPNNGKGRGRNEMGQLDRSVIIKLSNNKLPSTKALQEELRINGVIGDEVYGTQLQTSSVFGVPIEAKPVLTNIKKKVIYPDGRVVELEKPSVKLVNLGYGAMEKNTKLSLRFAQGLVGMGKLEQISEKDILKNADENDTNNDGISGKANFVYSQEFKKIMLGRFNTKASTPSVKEQTALAFHDDMGISSYLYPSLPCTDKQKECLNAPSPKTSPDITPLRLEAVGFYVSSLDVPKQRITHKKGQEIFNSIGCVLCHVSEFRLENGEIIKPYSDLLLHDMGDELKDERSDFLATPNEWRTQPLWGLKHAPDTLRQAPRYLHDARAKTLEEAILWHGGEAENIKLAFMNLDKKDRDELIHFLKEL